MFHLYLPRTARTLRVNGGVPCLSVAFRPGCVNRALHTPPGRDYDQRGAGDFTCTRAAIGEVVPRRAARRRSRRCGIATEPDQSVFPLSEVSLSLALVLSATAAAAATAARRPPGRRRRHFPLQESYLHIYKGSRRAARAGEWGTLCPHDGGFCVHAPRKGEVPNSPCQLFMNSAQP